MINFEGKELSAKSVIYGALITFAFIMVIFCVYAIAVAIKLIAMVLGPVIFSIVTTGVALMVFLGVVQLIKKKRMKGKGEPNDT
jgi:hypothetical protein